MSDRPPVRERHHERRRHGVRVCRARFRKGAGFERAIRLAGNRPLSRCPVILVAMQESSDLSALRHGVVRRVDGNGVREKFPLDG